MKTIIKLALFSAGMLLLAGITSCLKKGDGCYHCTSKERLIDTVMCGQTGSSITKYKLSVTPLGDDTLNYITCKD